MLEKNLSVCDVNKLLLSAGMIFTFLHFVYAEVSTVYKDPFRPYLQGEVPKVIELSDEVIDDSVRLKTLHILSREVMTDSGAVLSKIFAVVAKPSKPGVFPGLLILHGGGGSAEIGKAIKWAKRGYIAISLDLPGIMNAQKNERSQGYWKELPYGANRFVAAPSAQNSVLFDAVVAGLQAMSLLYSDKDTQPGGIGVIGISWGGYMTTMLAGLKPDYVKAAFSIYGSGYYDVGSTFKKNLDAMDAKERQVWLKYLDAGRRAKFIRSPYFIAAATNDRWFYPPAVMATLNAVSGEANHVFAPNVSHQINISGGSNEGNLTGWTKMEELFFDYYLKGNGGPFPKIHSEQLNQQKITFKVRATNKVSSASVHVSIGDHPWPDRGWEEISATHLVGGLYEATLPLDALKEGGFWYASISNGLPFTVSGKMMPISIVRK